MTAPHHRPISAWRIWTLALVLATSACGTQQPGSGTTAASAASTTSATAPAVAASTGGQGGWRLSMAEMQDIANRQKLPHRIFYAKPSSGPHAAWFDAVKRGDLATVQAMVTQGQPLEVRDEASLGQTALGWAAFIGYEDMVDFLIAQGADLRATDRGDVYNVLKSAVLGNNVRIVRKVHDLLRAETDLNDQTVESDAETLVMVAASNNRLETVKYLVEQGANVNLVSRQKDQSPLSFACDRGHRQMQQLLISYGAINHRTGRPAC